MSTGYHVLVPHETWPSADELQHSLARRGYPVTLAGLDGADGDRRLSLAKATGLFEVQLDGDRIGLHAAFGAVSGRRFDEDDTNDMLEEIGATFRVRDGNYQFGVGLGSDTREWRAAFYIMASLIKDFGGYGYEMQSETCGGDDWANSLILDAEAFQQKTN